MTLAAPRSPRIKHWRKDEYNTLVERGLFADQHLYLFRGELIEMAPMGNAHARALVRATKILFSTFDPAHHDIRVQAPFEVPGDSMPEPDLLVCTTDDGLRQPHPNHALLAIEISDTSLKYDREKALEYAAAGIPEYWIINLADRTVEVYTNPLADPSTLLGFRYPPPTLLHVNDSIALTTMSDATIKVADLLP